jgi:hypothetical protein
MGAHIGYCYNHQKDGQAAYVTGDTYDPGSGSALAYRGSCALVKGVLPAACTLNSDGPVSYNPGVTALPPLAGEIANTHGNTLLIGGYARPSAETAFQRPDPGPRGLRARLCQEKLKLALLNPRTPPGLNRNHNMSIARPNTICSPRRALLRCTVLLLAAGACGRAYAVPSFARQTGLACTVCHTSPPELTAFGRLFKLHGYTLTNPSNKRVGNTTALSLSEAIPLSVMLLMADTADQAAVPGTQNNTVAFPQQLSVFLAGEFAPHFGGFAQVTYDHSSDHFTMDNTDLRFAEERKLGGKDWIYGVTLNNNPSVEDVWSSTPAWGYPWISSGSSVGPLAAPILDGALAQDVVGVGGYSLWNNHIYTAFTAYRSEHAGGPQPIDGKGFAYNIAGAAPYWRVAWQQTVGNNYFEVGSYGIQVNSFPGAISGAEDHYVDPSFDMQWERPVGPDLIDAHAAFTHEKATFDASFAAGGTANPTDSLNTFRFDTTYHWRHRYTLTGAYFATMGTTDATLYAPAAVTGSQNGSPNTNGYIIQAGYWPLENIDLSLAYTGYFRFNGAGANYDGAGRNASDNNSVYLALWVTF